MIYHDVTIPLPFALNTDTGLYSLPTPLSADEIIQGAKQLLIRQFAHGTDVLDDPEALKSYLGLHLCQFKEETIIAVLLDTRCRILGMEKVMATNRHLIDPSLKQIINKTVAYQAKHIMLARRQLGTKANIHQTDKTLTHIVREFLDYIDVTLLDYFVVADREILSLKEQGEI